MGKKKPVYFFVIALSVMAVVRLLSREYKSISPAMATLVSYLCIAVAVLSLTKLLTNFRLENSYGRFIVGLFLCYQLVTIARGAEFSYEAFTKFTQSDYVMWPFIIPIFVFFDKDLITFAHLFKILSVIAVFGILISLAQPKLISQKPTVEILVHAYGFACGIIFLNANYLPKKMKWIAVAALLLGTAAFVYTARRNGIVSYAGLLMAGVFLNMQNSSANKLVRIIPFAGMLLIVGIFSLDYLPKSFTGNLESRANEDTRTGVFENYYADMKGHEIFGKGMNGKYYSPTGTGNITEDGDYKENVDFRDVIENGYMQQGLNGGIVYLVLFLLVTLPAVFLGFFQSRNQFCKACSIIIFLWLIDMFIFGLPRLTMQYILVWIAIGVCYTNSLRNKSNDEVADIFLNYEEYESTMVY